MSKQLLPHILPLGTLRALSMISLLTQSHSLFMSFLYYVLIHFSFYFVRHQYLCRVWWYVWVKLDLDLLDLYQIAFGILSRRSNYLDMICVFILPLTSLTQLGYSLQMILVTDWQLLLLNVLTEIFSFDIHTIACQSLVIHVTKPQSFSYILAKTSFYIHRSHLQRLFTALITTKSSLILMLHRLILCSNVQLAHFLLSELAFCVLGWQGLVTLYS